MDEKDEVLKTDNEIIYDEEAGDIEITPEMRAELENQRGDED